jgi:hypothetical protein
MRAKFQTLALSILSSSARRYAARCEKECRQALQVRGLLQARESLPLVQWALSAVVADRRSAAPVYPRPSVEQVLAECDAAYHAGLAAPSDISAGAALAVTGLDSGLAQP